MALGGVPGCETGLSVSTRSEVVAAACAQVVGGVAQGGVLVGAQQGLRHGRHGLGAGGGGTQVGHHAVVGVGGVPHIFGVSPRYEDLQWDGIDFTPEQFATITSIDKAAWAQEIELHTELFDKLKHNLPRELVEVKVALQKKLAA